MSLRSNNGYSLIEIVIALALFAVLVAAVGGWLLSNWQYIGDQSDRQKANELATEALAATASIRNRAWNEFKFSTSSIFLNGTEWQFAGEGSSEEIGKFTRLIKLSPLYSDAEGNLNSNSGAGEIDPLVKNIDIIINWSGPARSYEYRLASRLSDWHAKSWTHSNWSGGAGEAIWSAGNKYYQDDGNITIDPEGFIRLKEVATSTFAQIGELISGAFYSSSSAYSILALSSDISASCPECSVKIQIKTADGNESGSGEWSSEWCGPDGQDGDESDFFTEPGGEFIATDHNGYPWVKYRILLAGNSLETPVVREIKIYYHDN